MAALLLEAFGAGGVAVIVAAVLISWIALYAIMQQNVKRTTAELKREFEERLNAAMIGIRATQAAPAPPDRSPVAVPTAATPAPVPQASPVKSQPKVAASTAAPASQPAPLPQEEITPETVLILAAAVTAFLGKKVRIRSARMVYSHESFNSWSQQGRVFVQASHNLAQRGF